MVFIEFFKILFVLDGVFLLVLLKNYKNIKYLFIYIKKNSISFTINSLLTKIL